MFMYMVIPHNYYDRLEREGGDNYSPTLTRNIHMYTQHVYMYPYIYSSGLYIDLRYILYYKHCITAIVLGDIIFSYLTIYLTNIQISL